MIHNYYTDLNIENVKTEVVKVSIAYDIEDYMEKYNELLEWMKIKRGLVIHKKAKGVLPDDFTQEAEAELDTKIENRV